MIQETFELLDKIDQYKQKNQSLDYKSLEREGFNKSLAEAAKDQALIGWSGNDFYLTQKGYLFLIQHRTSRATTELSETVKKLDAAVEKANNEMSKHQVQMNKYTKILIYITIALFVLTCIQVLLIVARW
jgi:hypothetical protein